MTKQERIEALEKELAATKESEASAWAEARRLQAEVTRLRVEIVKPLAEELESIKAAK